MQNVPQLVTWVAEVSVMVASTTEMIRCIVVLGNYLHNG